VPCWLLLLLLRLLLLLLWVSYSGGLEGEEVEVADADEFVR
jgi:hypothetical protein